MGVNEPSYSVYAPSNFPSLAPVSNSSRSGTRPPLRGAAPQRGSGLFFLFMIGLVVAGAGVAGMTYLSPRLEARHSSAVPNNVVVNGSTDSTSLGPSSTTTLTSSGSAPSTPAPVAAASAAETATIELPATPPPPEHTGASTSSKAKPKRHGHAKRGSANAKQTNALPDSRMPTTAKVPGNPYPDRD